LRRVNRLSRYFLSKDYLSRTYRKTAAHPIGIR